MAYTLDLDSKPRIPGEPAPERQPPHERRLAFSRPLRLSKEELRLADPLEAYKAARGRKERTRGQYSVDGESHYKHLFSEAQVVLFPGRDDMHPHLSSRTLTL